MGGGLYYLSLYFSQVAQSELSQNHSHDPRHPKHLKDPWVKSIGKVI